MSEVKPVGVSVMVPLGLSSQSQGAKRKKPEGQEAGRLEDREPHLHGSKHGARRNGQHSTDREQKTRLRSPRYAAARRRQRSEDR
ncbi:MAG: hypothetical protein KJO34_07275, partial [Deltaproteobacteria bacterium]|nr:hypothetical protein [Deltaproteobacteria bacterium]